MSLEGRLRPVRDLTGGERRRMRALLAAYFAHVEPRVFERDLAEKEWVIQLKDIDTHELKGFSTLMRLYALVDGRRVTAFFSGDTIVDRACWTEAALPRHFARHAFALAAAERRDAPDAPVYWFLISSGYKTYRSLPLFFREFYPTYAVPTPTATRRLIDAFGALKFPREYDPGSGIIRPAHRTPLRAGVGDIEPRLMSNPHIAFFAAANPGHRAGDELACLTALDPDNLTPAGRRMLYGRKEAPPTP